MKTAPTCLLFVLLCILAPGCERSSDDQPEQSKRTGDGMRRVSTSTSEIPAFTKLPYKQTLDVLSVSFDTKDIPDAVRRSWTTDGQILVGIQFSVDFLPEELRALAGSSMFHHSTLKLEVGSKVYSSIGEHYSGMWGGPFSREFQKDSIPTGNRINLFFSVPEGTQKDDMRAVAK